MSYQSKSELNHYNERMVVYNQQLEDWKTHCTELNDHYGKMMADWQEQVDNDLETPEGGEPAPPVLPKEPEAPTPPPVYEARKTEEFEEIETGYGPALITPGRIIMASGNTKFAISEDDLQRDYVEGEP